MNNVYAPVLLSVYNRTSHFKQCVSSLLQCDGASETVVYISSDAAACPEDAPKVKEIREFIGQISGFKNVIPIFSKNNSKGDITKDAYKIVFKDNDRLIRSEDDNLFSKDFLNFVNLGLITYNERKDIYSISGYQYPIIIPATHNGDIYIWQGFVGWGVGIWKDKWLKIGNDKTNNLLFLNKFIKRYRKLIEFNRIGNHYVPALMTMLKQGKIQGDGFVSLYMFLNDMYSVFPTVSRVRNIGHDGSGVHCGYDNAGVYLNQNIFSGNSKYDMKYAIKPSIEMNRVLRKHFKQSIITNIKTILKIILNNLNVNY